jgi:hypothetical protein
VVGDDDAHEPALRIRPQASVRQPAAALLVVRQTSQGANVTAVGVEQPRRSCPRRPSAAGGAPRRTIAFIPDRPDGLRLPWRRSNRFRAYDGLTDIQPAHTKTPAYRGFSEADARTRTGDPFITSCSFAGHLP